MKRKGQCGQVFSVQLGLRPFKMHPFLVRRV